MWPPFKWLVNIKTWFHYQSWKAVVIHANINRVSSVPGCGLCHPFYLLCHPGELGRLRCSLPRSSIFSTDLGVLRTQINPCLSLSPYEPAPHTTTGPESTCLTDYPEDFCVQQETTGKSAWVGLAGKGARPQAWRHEISLHVSTAYKVERTDFECRPLTFTWWCTHYITHKANECNNMKQPYEKVNRVLLLMSVFLSLRMFWNLRNVTYLHYRFV